MAIVRCDNQITTDAEIIGVFLAQGGAPARVMDAWKRVIRGIGDEEETGAICNLREEVA